MPRYLTAILGLLLLVLKPACGQQQPGSPLLSSRSYATDGQRAAVLAPNTALQGLPLGELPSSSSVECSQQCLQDDECSWFNYCPSEGECPGAVGEPLGPGLCSLLAANASAVPAVRQAGAAVATVAGFPLRHKGHSFPGFALAPAQGMSGSDFGCPGSVLVGQCAFRTPVEATVMCMNLVQCRTVVVFLNGTDGRSSPVALLKTSSLPPGDTFTAPTVYSVTRLDNRLVTATHMFASEGHAVLPAPAEPMGSSGPARSGDSSQFGNPDPHQYFGCFIGHNAAVDGTRVEVLLGQPDAEACCRACRAWVGTADAGSGGGSSGAATSAAIAPPTACNSWNFCNRSEGCSYTAEEGALLELPPGGCELRYQDLISPAVGYPAALIAKGPDVPFLAGGPFMSMGPQVPGYTLLVGRGLFSAGRFNCSGTLRPEIQECVLQMLPDQAASHCNADPECKAFILKQQGVFGSGSSLAIFKHDANESAILFNPTGLLYLRNDPASAGTSGSGGLSGGAVAGIVVGATVVAAAAAGLAAYLLLQRRRRRALGAAKPSGSLSSSAGLPIAVSAAPAPPHSSSGVPAGLPAATNPAQTDSPFAAAAAEAAVFGPAAADPAAQAGAQRRAASGAPAAAAALPPAASAALLDGAGSGPPETVPELVQLVAAADVATSPQPEAAGGSASSKSGGSGEAAPRLPPPHAILPAGLWEHVVDPAAIEYCRLPSGKHLLGEGASGRVYKAKLRGEFIAVKEIDLGASEANRRTFLTEAVQLQRLRHAAVVGFVGVGVRGHTGLLLLEYMEGRDLYTALPLRAAGGSGQRVFGWWRLGRRVAFDVARALNYIHSQGVVHMDVKSSNCLLTASGSGKLGDCGLARLQTRTHLSDLDSIVGTYAWVAPEILTGGRQCSSKVDMFSYGVVLWEIVTGERPQRGFLRPPVVGVECPQEVADLIACCTDPDPRQRPTARQVMEQLGRLMRRSGRAAAGGGAGGAERAAPSSSGAAG